ncbi:MAG: hypothetical protein JSS24_13345 [Proteobacteria bacterium]|nr:hypothetical protein [Pseudomonadota bacterium]
MRIATWLTGALLLSLATECRSSGFFDATQDALRADIEYLINAEVLRLPLVSTWPMPIDEIHDAVAAVDDSALEPAMRAALDRIKQVLDTYDTPDGDEVRAAVSVHPTRFRLNQPIPRDDASAGFLIGRDHGRFTSHLSLSIDSPPARAAVPVDRQLIRPDGSYVSMITGNWIWSAGMLPRSWGPSQDDSVTLSANARPMIAIGLDRMSALAPRGRLLHWIGPWRFNAFFGGKNDNQRDDVKSPLWIGLRFTFKPFRELELGLTRTAQVCGHGRQCNLHTLKNWVFGNTNTGTSADISTATDPGNDEAGFDARWSSNLHGVPFNLYAQMIGEDQQGGVPFKYMGEGGVNLAFNLRSGSLLRVNVEYANTMCSFSTSKPIPYCAYHHYIYDKDGWRYRGYTVGSSWEGDAEVTSATLAWVRPTGNTWTVRARHGQLHRNDYFDPYNIAAPTRRGLDGADIEWRFDAGYWGAFRSGLGLDRFHDPATNKNTEIGRWYLMWSHRI